MSDTEIKTRRSFPIMAVKGRFALTLPWAMIAPHEAQAQENHRQSLERLAERGGLSASEAWAVMNGVGLRDYRRWPTDEAAFKWLVERVSREAALNVQVERKACGEILPQVERKACGEILPQVERAQDRSRRRELRNP
jgi:hypothetical protein